MTDRNKFRSQIFHRLTLQILSGWVMLPEIQRSGSADIIEKLLVRWIRNAQLFMQLIHQSGSLFHDIVPTMHQLTK